MKWDKVKKKYTLQKVDRDGKILNNMRNESGKKIKKSDKVVDVYKRWQQRTHLKLQTVGDKEDKKLMGQAKSANESRSLVKSFKGRHKDLNKGEDMRDNRKLLEKKGQKMVNKMRNNKSGFKKRDKNGNRVYSPKAQAKIERSK